MALALRVIPVLITRPLGIGLDDMFQYDMLARSLASGNGYRWYAPPDLARLAPYLHVNIAALSLDPRGMQTTFRAPLYPALLSLVYSVNGINAGRFFAARLVQALLGALLAPLTYFVAKRINSTITIPRNHEQEHSIRLEKAGRLAAWVVAFYPILLIYPLALATENLFFVVLLGSFLALLQLARATGSRNAVLYPIVAGVLLGLAALTRSVILPFAGLAVLWIWFSLQMRRAALFTLLALIVTVAPWIVRNSLLYGQLTGIETSMGYNLYLGYYPGSSGTFAFGPSLDLLSILDDRQRDQFGAQQAMSFIRQAPMRFPYLALQRLGYFFGLETRGFTYFYVNNFFGYVPPVVLISILLLLALPWVAVSLSAAFGIALLPKSPETLLLLLLLVGYLLPHVFILSEARFHLLLVPFFAVLAAGFWANGFAAYRSRGRLMISVSILIALLLLVNWGVELSRHSHLLGQMLGAGGNQLYLPY